MATDLLHVGQSSPAIPALVAAAGTDASRRFLEFFTVNIRNRNTRKAYFRAANLFARWCEGRGLAGLAAVTPMHVAAYIEQLGRTHAKPTVNLDDYLHEWIAAAGLAGRPDAPLFPTLPYGRLATPAVPLAPSNVFRMVSKRAGKAKLRTRISPHSFRATGITTYLQNGGKLEVAQALAGHESSRTTGLYDRRSDAVALNEVERIAF